MAKSLRPKSIFVCEATCSAVLHQKPFAIVSSFLVSESVTQETVSSHKQSTIQQWGCFFVFSALFSCLRMGKKRSLSEAQRAQIVILRQEGYTECAISERLAVSKTAVYQAVVKFKNCGSYSDCKRSGCPQKTTWRDNILIKRCVVKSLKDSSRTWGNWFENQQKNHQSPFNWRIRPQIRETGRKPRLTPAMKLKCLQTGQASNGPEFCFPTKQQFSSLPWWRELWGDHQELGTM